ncbi:MAG: C-terminal binding protein [Chloroflexi bacterium]|nr:C-terminal binding protein [Chloroflexota bacterium]
MAFRVAATFAMPGMDFGEDKLAAVGAVLERRLCQTPEEIIAAAHDADAVISPTTVQHYPRDVIVSLKQCRIIASAGIGYEGVDLDAATEMGIVVTNTPDYCLEEVSDHTMALILACARKLPRVEKAVREGKWTLSPELRQGILPPMFHLRGQVLGIIGFGRIARAVVPKAKGFGMRVIAFDPRCPADTMSNQGVEKVELDDLLRHADFVSIHASLKPKSHHMLGLEQFQKMKPTAYVINTARGPLIDEKALVSALGQKLIAGAGLDVLETEPPQPDNPLLSIDNVIVSGHTGQFSNHSEAELWRCPADEIVRALRGEWPVNVVNPQVRERFLSRWPKALGSTGGSAPVRR